MAALKRKVGTANVDQERQSLLLSHNVRGQGTEKVAPESLSMHADSSRGTTPGAFAQPSGRDGIGADMVPTFLSRLQHAQSTVLRHHEEANPLTSSLRSRYASRERVRTRTVGARSLHQQRETSWTLLPSDHARQYLLERKIWTIFGSESPGAPRLI